MAVKLQTYIIIGFLDLTYVLIVMASYIADVFQYMNRFYLSIFKITYEFHEGNLLARVPAFYLDFDDYFCDIRSNMEFKEICDRYDSFYNGSIVYLSLTLMNFILVVYNLLHLASLGLEWKPRCFFSMGCSHYLYPITHSIAVLAYLWTVNYYSLKPPTGFGSDFEVSAQAGFFLMLFAQVVSTIGMFVYLFSRNEATGNESFVEETNEDGYRKIEEKPALKKLPVLKVSQIFSSDSEEPGPQKVKNIGKSGRSSKEIKQRDSKFSGKSSEDKPSRRPRPRISSEGSDESLSESDSSDSS